MTKKKRDYDDRARARSRDNLGEGQDSFLDVVSNLVGVLIILIMIAGVRVRNATSALELASTDAQVAESSESGESAARAEYVRAVATLEALSERARTTQEETRQFNERAALLQQQADGAEAEYRAIFNTSAELEALLEREAQRRGASEKAAFDLNAAIIESEKKREDLLREKEALVAARPSAIKMENIPTPISQRVADGHEGFFRLKNGRISHIPLNAFQERVMLNFKSYKGELKPGRIENRIGPIDEYYFQYYVDLNSVRNGNGISYSFEFKYGECQPTREPLGEEVDVALSDPNSTFRNRLLKYPREDTTITFFLYPDSYRYLNDVKRFVFSLGYMMAIRPLPADAPVAVSPQGTASSTY